MVGKTKLISLPEAEAIAREATRAALAHHPPLFWRNDPNLTLGTFMPSESHYEFSLYLAGEAPSDAVVLTTATVDRTTGKVDVAVHDSALKQTL